MELKQLAPWNWFKKEEEAAKPVPIYKDGASADYPAAWARAHDAFEQLFREMSSPFLTGLPVPFGAGGVNLIRPLTDIAASGKEYVVTVEVPGVEQEHVQIEVSGDTLYIRGEKHQEQKYARDDYHCVERSYGRFQRQLCLPEDAVADKIEASFKKGVLTITIPRDTSKVPESRRIEVRAA